jgi:hypothetical protein
MKNMKEQNFEAMDLAVPEEKEPKPIPIPPFNAKGKGKVHGNPRCKLWCLPAREQEPTDDQLKKIKATNSLGEPYTVVLRLPLRVHIDTRPALLKFKQAVEFTDPKDVEKKVRKVELEGFFRRIGEHEYIQLDAEQLKKVLGWMQTHEIKPQDLTCTDIDNALKSKIELAPPEQSMIIVPVGKTKGGIVLP